MDIQNVKITGESGLFYLLIFSTQIHYMEKHCTLVKNWEKNMREENNHTNKNKQW